MREYKAKSREKIKSQASPEKIEQKGEKRIYQAKYPLQAKVKREGKEDMLSQDTIPESQNTVLITTQSDQLQDRNLKRRQDAAKKREAMSEEQKQKIRDQNRERAKVKREGKLTKPSQEVPPDSQTSDFAQMELE